MFVVCVGRRKGCRGVHGIGIVPRSARNLTEYHAEYRSMIADLKKIETEEWFRDFTVREKQIDDKTRKCLLNLVGNKPMVKCKFNGKKFEVLLDTGSMVTFVGHHWLREKFQM